MAAATVASACDVHGLQPRSTAPENALLFVRFQVYQQMDKKFRETISLALVMHTAGLSVSNVLGNLNLNTGQAWRAKVSRLLAFSLCLRLLPRCQPCRGKFDLSTRVSCRHRRPRLQQQEDCSRMDAAPLRAAKLQLD